MFSASERSQPVGISISGSWRPPGTQERRRAPDFCAVYAAVGAGATKKEKKNCTSNLPFMLVQWKVDEPLPTAAIKAPLMAKFEMFHLRLLAPNSEDFFFSLSKLSLQIQMKAFHFSPPSSLSPHGFSILHRLLLVRPRFTFTVVAARGPTLPFSGLTLTSRNSV